MQNFSFVDETLDINLTHTYNLSIQASLNGLSFCVFDPLINKFTALVHQVFKKDVPFDDFVDEFEKSLEKNDLLGYTYKNVQFIWESPRVTIIPSVFFNPQDIKKQFELNQKIDELDELHYKKLSSNNSYYLYTIPSQVASLIKRKYPKVSFFNHGIPWINYILSQYHSDKKKVFVHIHNDFIDIIVCQDDKILLCNNFQIKTSSDLLYFILYTYDQLDLNKETNELILGGLINKKSEVFEEIKKFLPHVKFEKPSENFVYSYTFKSIPIHTFSNLFNLQLCE